MNAKSVRARADSRASTVPSTATAAEMRTVRLVPNGSTAEPMRVPLPSTLDALLEVSSTVLCMVAHSVLDDEGEEVSATMPRPLAFAIGTAVHRALEATDFRRPRTIPRGERLHAHARFAADKHHVAADDVARAAASILDTFRKGELAARLARCRIQVRTRQKLSLGYVEGPPDF